ncbi:hypothetical protein JTB14_016487 [Gonioctena quinquepunctata]|nr:hypothetical protein JTB14_016487 [Gonioctena quinquepunctata]
MNPQTVTGLQNEFDSDALDNENPKSFIKSDKLIINGKNHTIGDCEKLFRKPLPLETHVDVQDRGNFSETIRVVKKTTQTIIDNIITNVDKDGIVNIQNDFYGLADHNGQIISLKNNALAIVQEASIHKRIFNPTNENKFRELLNASDREILFDHTDTNTASEQFYETLLCCFESAFPVRKIKCRPKPNNRGWLTYGIRTSCENKRCLLYLKRFTNDITFLKYVKKYCYLLKNLINQAKQQQIIEIVDKSECKIKTTREIINASINKKNTFNIPDNIKLKVNKEIIDDPEDVAN